VGKPSLNAAQPYAKTEGRMFLLVPAYLGCPGTKAVKRLLLLLLLYLANFVFFAAARRSESLQRGHLGVTSRSLEILKLTTKDMRTKEVVLKKRQASTRRRKTTQNPLSRQRRRMCRRRHAVTGVGSCLMTPTCDCFLATPLMRCVLSEL